MPAEGGLWAIDELARELPDVWFVFKPGTDSDARALGSRKITCSSQSRPKVRVASEEMNLHRKEGFISSHDGSGAHT